MRRRKSCSNFDLEEIFGYKKIFAGKWGWTLIVGVKNISKKGGRTWQERDGEKIEGGEVVTLTKNIPFLQIKSLVTPRIDSGIISIGSNTTYSIISKIINVKREKSRATNGPLGKISLNGAFLWTLNIQNQLKPSNTDKSKNNQHEIS